MNVFISWSGEISHHVAIAFRDCLPLFLHHVRPFVSSEDIEKGTVWGGKLAATLADVSCGIVCVTPDNINAPWINFEAGALFKMFNDANRVCPFLFRLTNSDVKGPLTTLFMTTTNEKDDIKKLVASINSASPEDRRLSETLFNAVFDTSWPQLKAKLDSIATSVASKPSAPHLDSGSEVRSILDEVVGMLRQQSRILSDPRGLLPISHIQEALRGMVQIDNPNLNVDSLHTKANANRPPRHRDRNILFRRLEMQRMIAQIDALLNPLRLSETSAIPNQIKTLTAPALLEMRREDITSLLRPYLSADDMVRIESAIDLCRLHEERLQLELEMRREPETF